MNKLTHHKFSIAWDTQHQEWVASTSVNPAWFGTGRSPGTALTELLRVIQNSEDV